MHIFSLFRTWSSFPGICQLRQIPWFCRTPFSHSSTWEYHGHDRATGPVDCHNWSARVLGVCFPRALSGSTTALRPLCGTRRAYCLPPTGSQRWPSKCSSLLHRASRERGARGLFEALSNVTCYRAWCTAFTRVVKSALPESPFTRMQAHELALSTGWAEVNTRLMLLVGVQTPTHRIEHSSSFRADTRRDSRCCLHVTACSRKSIFRIS